MEVSGSFTFVRAMVINPNALIVFGLCHRLLVDKERNVAIISIKFMLIARVVLKPNALMVFGDLVFEKIRGKWRQF
jgi:hypothetical protein